MGFMPPRVSALRPDRLLTLGLVRPSMLLRFRPGSRKVPILMYHGIRRGVGNRAAYFETNTSPEMFAAHMQYLSEHGYTATTLAQAIDYVHGTSELEKPVVITFDDGFLDFYTTALPILRQHAFTATMFVVSNFAGAKNSSFGDYQCMNWREVREIRAQGIEIGSHTVSHPVLHGLSQQQLAREIFMSKEAIENNIGCPVVSFSYPFAFPEHDGPFVQTLRTLLRECGYENGVSTIIGTAGSSDEAHFLPRLPVNSYDDLKLFGAKLVGAYDWLHLAQHLRKSLFGCTPQGPTRLRTGVADNEASL